MLSLKENRLVRRLENSDFILESKMAELKFFGNKPLKPFCQKIDKKHSLVKWTAKYVLS